MKPDEGYLDLNQHKRYYYPRRRGKRCWKCKSRISREIILKLNFFLWAPGPHQKDMFQERPLMVIKVIKKLKEDQEQKQEMLKPKKKQKQTLYDRRKIVEFRQEKIRWIMSYKGMDLTDYIGDYPFDKA